MTRIHSTLIALVIGSAATAGLYVAVSSAQLGQASAASQVPVEQLASRQARLLAWGRSLEVALGQRPPALPKLPHFAPVPPPVAPAVPVETVQPHVTYVQAPPVVKYEPAPPPPAETTTTSSEGDDSGDDGGDDSGGGDG